MIPPALALLGVLGVSACAGQMRFPVTQGGQNSLAAQNINVIRVTAQNIAQYRTPQFRANGNSLPNPPPDPSPYTYYIGPGDVLSIVVWADPERTQLASGAAHAAERGLVVNEQGHIFYPFVGTLRVSGRSAAQVRDDLTEQLRAFIADPQVEVTIATFNAHRATITGLVGAAGSVTLTNIPSRLLDIMNTAGFEEDSDLGQIAIRRRGSLHVVNLRAFIDQGLPGQNPIILPGDMIHVPRIRDNKIFTFGEIATSEIALRSDVPVSLTEVLAQVGGIDRIRADARGIFVFRRTPETPDGFDVFQFDVQSATALVFATDFRMAPLDIVFVTNDPSTRWNDTVGSLVSPFSGLLRIQRVAESF